MNIPTPTSTTTITYRYEYPEGERPTFRDYHTGLTAEAHHVYVDVTEDEDGERSASVTPWGPLLRKDGTRRSSSPVDRRSFPITGCDLEEALIDDALSRAATSWAPSAPQQPARPAERNTAPLRITSRDSLGNVRNITVRADDDGLLTWSCSSRQGTPLSLGYVHPDLRDVAFRYRMPADGDWHNDVLAMLDRLGVRVDWHS